MKKILLSTLFLVFINFLSHSQVVDVIGKGIRGENNSQLQLNDYQSIDKIEAHVTIKGLYSIPPSDGVYIDNDDTPSSNWKAIAGAEYLSPLFDASVGLYSRTFDFVSSSNLNATIKDEIKFEIHSFYGFVYRKDNNFNYKSYINTEPTFMWHNGFAGAYEYSIPINSASSSRNILVKIPISELDSGSRNVVINISSSSGEIDETYSENIYNLGNSLLLLEYPINDIPGNVQELIVKIYSPNPDVAEENGDSFFVGGVVVDVDKEIFDGCTLTQGYWKTHSDCKANGPKRDDTWDNVGEGNSPETTTDFFISEKTYCEVFDTQPSKKNGKYYILAHQYIATELNLFNNADPTDVSVAFSESTEFLKSYTPEQVKGNKSLEDEAVRLGGILDDFNNGRIGPGHCDEDEGESQTEQTKNKPKKEVSIYPNPANNSGKISFTAKQGGTSSVEMYNVNGRKVATLFSGKTKKNDQIVVEFDVNAFKNGLYFTIIKNGTDIYKEKLAIAR